MDDDLNDEELAELGSLEYAAKVGNRRIVWMYTCPTGDEFAMTDNGWVWIWCEPCNDWHPFASGN